MANAVGAGKGGKAADKVGPSDTINFTYSLAVETALEDLQKEEELQATRSRRLNVKKKGMKGTETDMVRLSWPGCWIF